MSTGAPAKRLRVDHNFYTTAGCILAGIVFVGFARTYYLKRFFLVQPLPSLLHIHAAVMTLWYILFIVQVRLIAARRVELHRTLGVVGVFLAVVVAVLGAKVSIDLAGRDLRANPASSGAAFLLGLQLFAIVLPFVLLVATGLSYRRRSDYHKRLMALAMLSTLGPAVTRLPLGLTAGHNIPATILIDISLLLLFVIADTVRHRRLHPASGWGGGMLIAIIFVVAPIAGSTPWISFVRSWLL